jgi:hypothetical protein
MSDSIALSAALGVANRSPVVSRTSLHFEEAVELDTNPTLHS